MAGGEIGYYTLPVIVSFKGIDSQVEAKLGKSMQDLGKKTGEQLGTAVITSLDPTRSPKVATAIKTGAGKKMGDAITTEVAKNVDGKKIGEKISTDVQQSVKAGAGKKIGQAVTEEVTKSVDLGSAGSKVGEKLGERVREGLKNAKIPETLKNAIDSPVGRQIGTTIATEAGKAIGEQLQSIPQVAAAADVIKQNFQPAKELLDSIRSVKAGDVAGLESAASAAQTIGKNLGVDVSGITDPLGKIGTSFAGTKDNIKGTTDSLMELSGSSGKIAGGLTTIANAAGPLAAAFAGLQLMPGFMDSMNKVAAGKGGWKDYLETAFPAANISANIGKGIRTQLDDLNRPAGPRAPAQLPVTFGKTGTSATVGTTGTPVTVGTTGTPEPGIPAGYHLDPQSQTLVANTPVGQAAPPKGYWPGYSQAVTESKLSTTNVSASSATISVGSATISGVSVPAYSGSGPGTTPVRQGYKSWYQSGGEIPIIAHAGEHMFTVDDVDAMGGQAGVYDFRKSLHDGRRRPRDPNRAAIKGVSYDAGGEIIAGLAKAIADPVSKAAAQGAAQGATQGGMGGSSATDSLQFLSDMLGVGAQGAGETLGLGTVFPDPMANPNVKSLMALFTAFKGPITGAMKGKLGIQQPGWHPGMPVDAMAGDQGSSMGSVQLPFGLPSIDIPAAPAPGPPEGGPSGGGPGGAGPGSTYNVDASINYHDGSVLGVDPAAQRAADTRTQERNLATTVAPTDPANH